MNEDIDINKLDEQMQKKGCNFLGPILHYEKALKKQANIYEKNGKYIVFGVDKTGKNTFQDPISKKEAENKVKKSVIEISKFMLGNSE